MNGKKSTRGQRKFISKAGLDTYVYLVQKDTPDFLQVVHKDTGEERIIDKKTLSLK